MKNRLIRIGILVAIFILLSNVFVATGLGKGFVNGVDSFLTSVTNGVTNIFSGIGENIKSSRVFYADSRDTAIVGLPQLGGGVDTKRP